MGNTQVSRVTTSRIAPELPSTTSIGRKFWMASSGIILLVFVIGHMVGNLQVFMGQDQIGTYAQKLRAIPAILWAVRIFFLVWAVVHIIDGFALWLKNRRSRPVPYHSQDFQEATIMSRTMIWSGLGIGFFVIYHLLHFTMFVTNPEYAYLKYGEGGHHDVYSMMVLGFSNPLISAVYILAIFFLALHLSHGIASFFQTIGWNKTELQPTYRRIAYATSAILFVGYVSIPTAILLGIIKLPEGVVR